MKVLVHFHTRFLNQPTRWGIDSAREMGVVEKIVAKALFKNRGFTHTSFVDATKNEIEVIVYAKTFEELDEQLIPFLNETAEEGSTYFVMDAKELEEPK